MLGFSLALRTLNLQLALTQTIPQNPESRIEQPQELVIKKISKNQQSSLKSRILLAGNNNLQELTPNENPLVIPNQPQEVIIEQLAHLRLKKIFY